MVGNLSTIVLPFLTIVMHCQIFLCNSGSHKFCQKWQLLSNICNYHFQQLSLEFIYSHAYLLSMVEGRNLLAYLKTCEQSHIGQSHTRHIASKILRQAWENQAGFEIMQHVLSAMMNSHIKFSTICLICHASYQKRKMSLVAKIGKWSAVAKTGKFYRHLSCQNRSLNLPGMNISSISRQLFRRCGTASKGYFLKTHQCKL